MAHGVCHVDSKRKPPLPTADVALHVWWQTNERKEVRAIHAT